MGKTGKEVGRVMKAAYLGVDIAERTAEIPSWVNSQSNPEQIEYRPNGKLPLICADSLALHKELHFRSLAAKIIRSRGYEIFQLDLSRKQTDLNKHSPQNFAFRFPTWEREPFVLAHVEVMANGFETAA